MWNDIPIRHTRAQHLHLVRHVPLAGNGRTIET